MNRYYQSRPQSQLQSQLRQQRAARQPRVAVYSVTQSANNQYLLPGFVAIAATLLIWVSLLH